MGRKSSAKDRAYITQSERKDGYGSVRDNASANSSQSAVARRAALVSLPFTHCRLTCEPWLDPVCSPDGDVFDVTAAVPAVRASGGRNPLTGEALALKDLIRLHFHRVGSGGGGGEGGNGASAAAAAAAAAPFGCPVTGKAFTPSSHIVAIRPTGNVFSYEAVERLNLKPKNFRDLLDDAAFARSDVIHLQDPADVSGTAAARAEKARAFAAAGGGGGGGGLGAAAKPPSSSSGAAAAAAAAAADEDPSGLDKSALGKDAQRILARLAAASTGPGAPPAGGRGDRGASRVPGADPRLRAPERERIAAPAFKSGAATWDTTGDDTSQQQLSFQMRKDAERRRRREEAEEEAKKVREANRKARSEGRGGDKRAPSPYGPRVFERLALAAKAAAAAASRPVAFTSSVTPLVRDPSSAAGDLPPRPPRFRRPSADRGYCRLRTSLGDLNLELFAEAAPRAVENFVVLARSGYFDGCVFHRSVRNFCAQSGDPTGTGRGGESIYGGPFPYEGPGASKTFGGGKSNNNNNKPPSSSSSSSSSSYCHDARGVLAMANSGDRDSNGSQFYILYKSARHLDGKHTVFGRVAGGAATLDAIEGVPTDEKDRPLIPVVIEGAEVFVDPFERGEGEEEEEDESDEDEGQAEGRAAAKRAVAEAAAAEAEAEGRKRARWFSGPAPVVAAGGAGGGGVGRYLGDAAAAAPVARQPPQAQQQQQARAAAPPAKKKGGGGFGNFDAW